jgi:ABC-type glycerol-3-phosphate transport system substrate-binding protein
MWGNWFVQRKSVPIAFAAGFLLTLTSCQRYVEPPAPPPFHGTTLTLACPSALVAQLRSQSSVWQARQQARVVCKAYDADQGPVSVAGADVWVVAVADMPRWAGAGKLAPAPGALTQRGGAFNWPALLPAYRDPLLLWDSKAFAVPLVGEAPVCFFRADLFASADYQARFRAWRQARSEAGAALRELRAPATWEEYALAAEFFRQHHPRGKPAPSLPPLPARPTDLDRLFYTIAASYARRAVREDEPAGVAHLDEVFSFHYDQKTGKPLIDTAGFTLALKLMQRLQACRPEGSADAPQEAFLRGDAVLCIADAGLVTRAQQVPALRDRVGVCPVPGAEKYVTLRGQQRVLKEGSNRVPYLGGAGWLAVVPTATARQEAAWDLLQDLAGPERSAQVALEPSWGGPTRADQVLRERWDAYDLDASRSLALKDAVSRAVLQHGLKNPALCLRIPDQASHRAALVEGVRRALLDRADAAAELVGVARKWAELDAKRGQAKHLAEYRISLGLLGN